MWTPIDKQEILTEIKSGSLITQNPGNPVDIYKIASITPTYIKAVHFNGKNSVKIFPAETLIGDQWWKQD